MGTYAEGEEQPSETEGRIIAALVKQLREPVEPPERNWFEKNQSTINVVLAALLTIGAGVGAYYMNAARDRDSTIAMLVADVNGLKADRIAFNTWKDGIELDRQRFRLLEQTVARQEAELKAQGDKLEAGRTVRERDIAALQSGQNQVALELNGLKVELGFIRRSREDRDNGERPFGRQGQRWSAPEFPLILRAIYRPGRDVADILRAGR